MKKIVLKNIRGIKDLEFVIPKKGLYVITGCNGCGKTTLLTTLGRIGDSRAFDRFKSGRSAKLDTFENATIRYESAKGSMEYHRSDRGWEHKRDASFKGLQDMMGYPSVKFLSTTGIRFYQTEPTNLIKKGKAPSLHSVPVFIKDGLNQILGTSKFTNLKYALEKNKHGRQKVLHRNNKLYVISETGSPLYTELNFSLGERLLLNALEELENVLDGSMLIIDEIELALHPSAQARFYKFIEGIVKDKNITCFISTHSSTLISIASNRFYLENNNGYVQVLDNCKPAYILQDISVQEDYHPDYVFFVEDDMAKAYLEALVRSVLIACKKRVNVKVLPVGGWPQLLRFSRNWMKIPPFSTKNVYAFPDYDVIETINQLRKDHSEEAAIFDYDSIHDNVNFLDITPDPAIWEWLVANPEKYVDYIRSQFGEMSCKFSDVIKIVVEEEKDNSPEKPIYHAKGCIANIREKLIQTEDYMNYQIFTSSIFVAYVRDRMENVDYRKTQLEKLLKIIG